MICWLKPFLVLFLSTDWRGPNQLSCQLYCGVSAPKLTAVSTYTNKKSSQYLWFPPSCQCWEIWAPSCRCWEIWAPWWRGGCPPGRRTSLLASGSPCANNWSFIWGEKIWASLQHICIVCQSWSNNIRFLREVWKWINSSFFPLTNQEPRSAQSIPCQLPPRPLQGFSLPSRLSAVCWTQKMGIEVDFKDFVEEHKIVLDKIYNVTVFTVDSYFGVTFSTGQENPPTFRTFI